MTSFHVMVSRRGWLALALIMLLGGAAVAGADEKIRVACVGDSITKGAGAGNGESYPAQLGVLLGAKYDVRNFGVNGATLLKSGDSPYWRRKELKAALGFQPNIVIIKLGTNDSKPLNWKHKDQYAADMKAMIGQFAALPSKPKIFLGRPTVVARDNFGIQAAVVKGEIWPLLDQVARDEKLTVIDFATPLADRPALLPDGVHPNAEGYKKLAAAARDALLAEPEK
ncbi:MAG: sialate O-acetylesterase [Planctomycetia bacterium]|nr:sialate O-acetylesterase [Planctomycetia bacterium]